MNASRRNTVYLFSEANFLATSLLENFLSKKFYIIVFTKNVNAWQISTSHIANKERFSLTDNFRNVDFRNTDYALYIEGFNKKSVVYTFSPSTKTIVIVPFEKYEWYQSRKYLNTNSIVIYTGDIVGPRIELSNDTFISKILNDISTKRILSLGVGELFYPIFINEFVKHVSSYLFSFGPYGKEILLLGNETSSTLFWRETENLIPHLKIKYDTDQVTRNIPPVEQKIYLDSDFKFLLSETFNWIKVKETKIPKKNKARNNNKSWKYLYISVVVMLFLPFFMFVIGGLIYYNSYRNYSTNKIILAKPFFALSRESARFFSVVPIAGRIYKEVEFGSSVLIEAGQLTINLQPVIKISNDLFKKVLGNEVYNVSLASQELANSLQPVYQDIQAINEVVNNEKHKNTYLRNYLTSKIDVEKIKDLINQTTEVSRFIPDVLGANKNTTYLVLFQNNLELRPTGGFIGSYGLVTFEKGRLSDMIISDVYSIDSQLKGHIEPPDVLKEQLGITSWYLRDSNWDPDFTESAKRAEWFLDKEIGKSVNGVIAVNLDPIKELLSFTGPIFLSDLNEEISTTNFYDKAQEEVNNNSFLTDSRKTSFLTPLTRNILSDFSKTDTKRRFEMLRILYHNFESKDIQVFLHNEKVQKFFSESNWDGSINSNRCATDCYQDLVGLVEANVGQNRANQFIKRNVAVEVSIINGKIVRNLKFDIINTANASLGPPGKYKVYLRLLIPKEVNIITGKVEQVIEVLPGESKSAEFVWESAMPSGIDKDKYYLHYRKQSGIEPHHFSLTVDSITRYNDLLSKDLFFGFNNGR